MGDLGVDLSADAPAVQRETSSRPRHEGPLLGRT
jgi:hypothetical protein